MVLNQNPPSFLCFINSQISSKPNFCHFLRFPRLLFPKIQKNETVSPSYLLQIKILYYNSNKKNLKLPMSTKLLFLCLFSLAFLQLSLSLAVPYSCPASSCPTGCCNYYSSTYAIADPTCSLGSTYCACSTSTSCPALYRIGYNNCTSYSSCASKCCLYTSTLYYNDSSCSSSYCSCSNYAANCTYQTSYAAGFRACSAGSGCCYYSASLTYPDYTCQSSYCTQQYYSTSCSSSSTGGSYAAGYRACSTSYTSTACCYYSISMTTSDYSCNSFYCSSASSYHCTSSGGSSGGGSYNGGSFSSAWSDWTVADQLTLASGNSYVVVNYSGWKAAVAVGAAIAGVWFFLNLWLMYYKCFAKPKNWVRP